MPKLDQIAHEIDISDDSSVNIDGYDVTISTKQFPASSAPQGHSKEFTEWNMSSATSKKGR